MDTPAAHPDKPRRGRPPVGFSIIAGFGLHTLAVASLWKGWSPGSRSAWLVYMDLPLSLLWADLPGREVLWASLLAGGLWWGLLTLFLVYITGRWIAGGR